ncbi:unnamed protein product [Sympodiomycopsis kandeliae]
MSVVIPDWVTHISTDNEEKKKKPTTIFSLSVHPDGSRLATGGLDQKIKIWATEPIQDAKVEAVPGVHKLLSTLSRHSGSVLSLRFSPSGRYLASGSDDTICLVWEFDPSGQSGGMGSFGSSSFGSSEQNVESWKIHRRLTGHESDVVDIAWSHDDQDSYLATVGLDATINIWSGPSADGRGGCERIRTIRAHDGFVKGVVWDPRGQYLATQSDDKTLKLWSTKDWSCIKVISSPFVNSPTSNFFGRLSWSPDGNHIVAANAMDGPVFVSSIIQRDTWSSDLKLVGHEDSVVVTAFSPRLFRVQGDDPGSAPASIVALGSRDQSISIWITGMTRPIAVLKDVFDRQVTDLSWSQDGLTLYASSTAGAIAAVVLPKTLFSEVLPRNAVEIRRPQVGHGYGGSGLVTNGAMAQAAGTAQRPNILQPRKGGKGPQPAAARLPPPSAAPRAGPAPATAIGGGPRPANARAGGERLQQHIQILPNGKRRIRPTLIGDDSQQEAYGGDVSMDVDATPLPQTSIASTAQYQSNTASSSGSGISTDQLLDVLSRLPALQQQPQMASAPAATQTQPPGVAISDLPAIVSALKDLAGPSTTFQNTEQSFESALAVVRQSKARAREGRVIGSDVAAASSSSSSANRRPSGVADLPLIEGSSQSVLSPAPVRPVLRRSGEGGSIEVNNFDDSRSIEVRVSDSDDRLIWMDFLSSQVVRCALSLGYAAFALSDGTIQVYTAKGGRLVGNMALDSCASFLECRGSILLVITSRGDLYRWNLQTDRELHRPISCTGILRKQDDIQQVYLHTNGAPILIVRSSETAWTIDPRKNAWVRIVDGSHSQRSIYWESRGRGRISADDSSVSANSAANSHSIVSIQGDTGRWREPIKTIESEINSLVVARVNAARRKSEETDANGMAVAQSGAAPPPSTSATESPHRGTKRPPPDDAERQTTYQVSGSLRHMEMRLSGSILLNSREEYISFLRQYTRKLADENLKGTAEELIRDFLGPVFYTPGTTSEEWQPTLFDGQLQKRVILKELLQIMKKSRVLESMVERYVELLKSINSW